MSDIILKVENVSKQYQLGTFGTKTIGGDVHRWWTTKVLGKEDPFLKVGDVNDRTSKEKADFVWALKDINFEVKRGEVLGIIGKNGAGKSTLLKLLSRITSPTTGTIKSAGRMASLLEVGTGFHPELTGLENIYLNGAILGMTKSEIKRKLEEIIDFSGCALYIDTPVKRYSSGMKVRLAFAVAAYLDPDILVVDEVLAVGDAEFQKKAIGRMQDVSNKEGRTVLFVSHNLEQIEKLCRTGILLNKGRIECIDKIESTLNLYKGLHEEPIAQLNWLKIISVSKEVKSLENFSIILEITSNLLVGLKNYECTLKFKTTTETVLFRTSFNLVKNTESKSVKIRICIPKLPLNYGNYILGFGLGSYGQGILYIDDFYNFEVLQLKEQTGFNVGNFSSVLVLSEWEVIK